MVDWEFWGSKKAWIAMGVGVLSIALGLVLFALGFVIGIAPVVIGALVFSAVGYYLVYWENWVLLKEKKGG